MSIDFRKWHDKRYYSLNAYCKNIFGEKCYKVSLDAGFTCPNRDGTLDTRGCNFCSVGGSGDFAARVKVISDIGGSISSEICKAAADRESAKLIGYFQAFTSTYAKPDYLKAIYSEALSNNSVIGISIGTRPDCLGDEVLEVLTEVKSMYPDKFIWIELGLQTCHEKTAEYIRRCYKNETFEAAIQKLKALNIPVIVHVILGLPGEDKYMMLETVKYVCNMGIFGIKLQLLHVLKNTDISIDFENGLFDVLTLEEYIDILIDCISIIPKEIVIHRVTGDGPKDILIAPKWSGNKKRVLNLLHKQMKERNVFQGCNLKIIEGREGIF